MKRISKIFDKKWASTVLMVVKLLLFYKCFIIFFKRLGSFLQFFLYFCALEVVPLALLWGGMLLMSRFLIYNY